jgi:anti-sigma-K factor RskA
MTSIGPDDWEGLAAEFALGTLDGEPRQAAERLFETDPAFQTMVLDWQERLSGLQDHLEPARVGDGLWSRIESGLVAQPVLKPRPAEKPAMVLKSGLWESLAFWRLAGLSGVFASLLLAIGLALVALRPLPTPILVAVLNTAEGKAAAVVNAYANGEVVLIPLDNIEVPQGRIIEVWTLQNREQGPVSIGRTDRARKLRLDLRTLSQPDINHLFELTLEPQGGSPTGKPTGPILMKGLTARSI